MAKLILPGQRRERGVNLNTGNKNITGAGNYIGDYSGGMQCNGGVQLSVVELRSGENRRA
jgi:hypothetical protein